MSEENIKIYQLKITLKGSKPLIWRTFQVRSDIKLNTLHDTIQIVMGWDDYHLHQFIINEKNYGIQDPDFGDDIIDENQIKLDSIINEEKQTLNYQYDFGDSWDHIITVQKIMNPEKGVSYPMCIDGKLACPPEDCGGIWGYHDLLEILNNPNDPEHKDMVVWTGGDFDPIFFDADEINEDFEDFL